MIVLSNGIAKSASTLIANYQERLLDHTGRRSGQDVLIERLGGRYLPAPGRKTVLRLVLISVLKGDIVVKNHWRPTPMVRRLIQTGIAKATVTYRDPRDILLSAMDHGKRSREGKDPSGAFAEFSTVEESIPMVLHILGEAAEWRRIQNGVHFIRYEELMRAPIAQLKEMTGFLGWNVPDEFIRNLVEAEEKAKASSWNFNKGTTERWKSEMNEAQQQRCREAFDPYLREMGYEA